MVFTLFLVRQPVLGPFLVSTTTALADSQRLGMAVLIPFLSSEVDYYYWFMKMNKKNSGKADFPCFEVQYEFERQGKIRLFVFTSYFL